MNMPRQEYFTAVRSEYRVGRELVAASAPANGELEANVVADQDRLRIHAGGGYSRTKERTW